MATYTELRTGHLNTEWAPPRVERELHDADTPDCPAPTMVGVPGETVTRWINDYGEEAALAAVESITPRVLHRP